MSLKDQLEADHAEIDQLLDQTLASLAIGECVDVYQKLDLFWARLAMHIRAEHRTLFPVIRTISQTSQDPANKEALSGISDLLDELRRDHDFFMHELARAIKAMRLTFYFGNEMETLAVIREFLGQIKERLEIHNRIEEARIYTLATGAFLPPAELRNFRSPSKRSLVIIHTVFARAGAFHPRLRRTVPDTSKHIRVSAEF